MRVGKLMKIVVTGPESTGKTTLSETLASRFKAALIPEYARSYLEDLDRSYVINDLENIARYQIQEEKRVAESTESNILLMDTWLIVTQVWFEVVYGSSPEWIRNYIKSADIDLFLVCSPDLPWIADPVRENGGEMRHKLFERYCQEIKNYGFPYEIIKGSGELRTKNGIEMLQKHLLM